MLSALSNSDRVAQESEQLAQLDSFRQRLNSSRKLSALEKDRLAVAQNDVQRNRYLRQKGVISKTKLEEVEGVMFERPWRYTHG